MTVLGPPSTKEQIVQAAERLFALHGLDGVSLRQIGAAAGCGNNSAVQYHFGCRDQLVQAIYEYRLPELYDRREQLVAERRPETLRVWLECFLLPVFEQSDRDGSHYFGFVSMLQRHPAFRGAEPLPERYRHRALGFIGELSARMGHIPPVLRRRRLHHVLTFGIEAAAERERTAAEGGPLMPSSLELADLMDGLVAFLDALPSAATLAAVGLAGAAEPLRPTITDTSAGQTADLHENDEPQTGAT